MKAVSKGKAILFMLPCISRNMTNIIAYLPTEVLSGEGKIIKLRHPKADKEFMVYYTPKMCFELFTKRDKHGSWFVDDNVVSSNELIIACPLDPYFLTLPYLLRNPTHFQPINQILVDQQYPAISYMESLLTQEGLAKICETRKSSDEILVKFDKSKVLEWLSGKVRNVVEEMKVAGVDPGFNSSLTEDEYIRYGCGIVSDYIPASLSKDLYDKFGIELVETEDSEKPPKRQKISSEKENIKVSATSKSKLKPPKQSRAQKQLAAVNTKGMKSMTAFFSKK